jgi:hypothetical protein
VALLLGCLAMYGAQIAAQGKTQAAIDKTNAAIENFSTKFDGYTLRQSSVNDSLQRQIDDGRRESALNRVNLEDMNKEIAKLQGILLGAGIKGAQK